MTGDNENGKHVENQPVSNKSLIKLFNLPIDLSKEQIVFEADKRTTTVIDMATRKPRSAMVRRIVTLIRGTYNRSQYEIQYYEGVQNRRQGGFMTPKYTPRKIDFRGNTMTLNVENQLDLIVLLALSRACESSPFRTNTDPPHSYVIVDREERAKESLAKEQRISRVRNIILNEISDVDAMRIARGVIVNKRRLPSNRMNSPIECRALLSEQVVDHVETIEAALGSRAVMVAGIMYHAIDKNIIRTKPVGGGVSSWVWTESAASYAGHEIIRVPVGAVPTEALLDHLMAPANTDNFRSIVDSALDGTVIQKSAAKIGGSLDVSTVKEEDIDYEDPATVIDFLAGMNRLNYDGTENAVYLLNDMMQRDGKAIKKWKDPVDEWLKELKDISSKSPQFSRLVSAAKSIIEK